MRIAELGTPFAEKNRRRIGFFDSIHIGHRDIIAKTIRQGKGQRLSIRTFYVFQQSRGVFRFFKQIDLYV